MLSSDLQCSGLQYYLLISLALVECDLICTIMKLPYPSYLRDKVYYYMMQWFVRPRDLFGCGESLGCSLPLVW